MPSAGIAGTVQEVFQDACENYYADESSVAPMVLVGGALLFLAYRKQKPA